MSHVRNQCSCSLVISLSYTCAVCSYNLTAKTSQPPIVSFICCYFCFFLTSHIYRPSILVRLVQPQCSNSWWVKTSQNYKHDSRPEQRQLLPLCKHGKQIRQKQSVHFKTTHNTRSAQKHCLPFLNVQCKTSGSSQFNQSNNQNSR